MWHFDKCRLIRAYHEVHVHRPWVMMQSNTKYIVSYFITWQMFWESNKNENQMSLHTNLCNDVFNVQRI